MGEQPARDVQAGSAAGGMQLTGPPGVVDQTDVLLGHWTAILPGLAPILIGGAGGLHRPALRASPK